MNNHQRLALTQDLRRSQLRLEHEKKLRDTASAALGDFERCCTTHKEFITGTDVYPHVKTALLWMEAEAKNTAATVQRTELGIAAIEQALKEDTDEGLTLESEIEPRS